MLTCGPITFIFVVAPRRCLPPVECDPALNNAGWVSDCNGAAALLNGSCGFGRGPACAVDFEE